MNWIILNILLISFLFFFGNLVIKILHKIRLIKFKTNSFEKIILGIFGLGFINLLFNFFYKLNSIYYFILITFFFIIIIRYLNKKDLKKCFFLIIFSIFFTFLSNQMIPGYDAGLYHIPYQKIIREEKIIFGLSNLHDRYGLTTINSYVAAILWVNKKFNLVAFFQTIYYQIFFLYLFYLIKEKKINNLLLALSSLIFFPVWYRYADVSFGLVDLPYGIIFFLTIFQGIKILKDIDDIKNSDNLFFLILFSSFGFAYKASGIILYVYCFFIIFFLLKKNKIKFYNLLLISILPLLISFIWIIRNFVISSCLVYPLLFTCFNTPWSNISQVADIQSAISIWAYRSFKFLSIKNFLYLIFPIFCFLFLFYFKSNVLKKIKISKKYFYIVNSIFFIFILLIYSKLEILRGFSSQITAGNYLTVNNIIIYELFYLMILSLVCFFLNIVFSNFYLKDGIYINYDYRLIPLVFIFFSFCIWFIAPNPRFAIGAFASIGLIISFYFFKNSKVKNYYFYIFLKILILLFVIKINIIDSYRSNNIFIVDKILPNPEVDKRSDYGVTPKDDVSDNRCWLVKDCFIQSKKITVDHFFLNYKIIKLEN